MILEKVGGEEQKPMIVLHEHLWSAITWPLIETPGPGRSTYFSLDPNGQAEWFTMFDPSLYQVVPAVPVMSEGWLCLISSSASQHFLEYVLRHYSCDLSFHQLCVVARYLCIEGNVACKSRSNCSSLWLNSWTWTLPRLWKRTRKRLPRKGSQMMSLI